jgi:hypothetical protein
MGAAILKSLRTRTDHRRFMQNNGMERLPELTMSVVF